MRNSNGHYLEVGNDFINVYQDDNLISELIGGSQFSKIQDAWVDKNNILWIADSSNSLLKYENFEFIEIIKPNGPASNTIENIKIQDELFVYRSQQYFEYRLQNRRSNRLDILGSV